MDSKTSITLSNKISGDQDADATLFGGVLTSHSSRLLAMTQVRDKKIRFASLDLIGNLLRQGQVNPNETVPFLLALQGDVEENAIRALALKLLMIEGEKRPDMLRQRVCAGVKQASLFQHSVYPDKEDVSALVKIMKNGSSQTECVFGGVYKECISSMKKQRRGLFRNLLGLFDLQNKRSGETNGQKAQLSDGEIFLADLPLLSFTSQVLAYLPYAFASDPLYIVHNISSTLALQGADVLDRFASFLRPYNLSSSDEMDESNFEEDCLEIAAKRHVPRHAKEATPLFEPDFDVETFSALCSEAGALTLLLRLKSFLRNAYNLSEARVLGYNPEAKERVADKAISRASVLVFDSKLAMQSSHGGEDTTDIDCMIIQYAEFRRFMRADAHVDIRSDESDDEEDVKSSKRRRIEDSEDKVEE
jgi:cohesin loading factor subunit SCC2